MSRTQALAQEGGVRAYNGTVADNHFRSWQHTPLFTPSFYTQRMGTRTKASVWEGVSVEKTLTVFISLFTTDEHR